MSEEYTFDKESILISTKKMLGIMPEQTEYDLDIIIHINTIFSILHQMGVGPDNTFAISDSNSKWSDFLGDDENLEMVKSYIYLRVRKLFDTSLSSNVASAIDNSIEEIEWRLYIEEDTRRRKTEG